MTLRYQFRHWIQRKRSWSKYEGNTSKRKKKILVSILHIFILAVLICEETIFLNHYEELLKTCEVVSTEEQSFRNIEITDDVLSALWKGSMGNKESFVKKVTMNLLLNNFSVKQQNQMVQSYWYFWDSLVPKTLYDNYYEKYKTIFSDIVYFPVADDVTNKETVYFHDSWMKERTFGGTRGHEGTDVMANNNLRGYFPIVSITSGTVEQKGWLRLGGYRLGIRSASGAYCYYAHLDSYAPDLEVGDTVSPGQFLGMMGNTGYSEVEGTRGKFDVHLHVGIYIMDEGNEVSVNPYWILKFLEQNKVKWTE